MAAGGRPPRPNPASGLPDADSWEERAVEIALWGGSFNIHDGLDWPLGPDWNAGLSKPVGD